MTAPAPWQPCGWTLAVRPERVGDYVRAHEAVWPEMLAAISAAGIRSSAMFLHGTRVFGSYEARDDAASAAALAATDVNRRWQAAMEPLIVPDTFERLPLLLRHR